MLAMSVSLVPTLLHFLRVRHVISKCFTILGYVLSSFISKVEEEENKKYLTRVYVGDGRADYCASKSLNKNDYVLYRLGFTLHKLIKKNDEKSDAFPNHSSWQSFSEMQEKLDMIMNNSFVNSN